MNNSDLIAIAIAVVAFAVGYGVVSWLISIARKGLGEPDYRNGLPKRERFGEPAAPPPGNKQGGDNPHNLGDS